MCTGRRAAVGARAGCRGESQPPACQAARYREDHACPSAPGASSPSDAPSGAGSDPHSLRRRSARGRSRPGLLSTIPSAPPLGVDGRADRRRRGSASWRSEPGHHGVLLLDELPEFVRPALEAIPQPLEDGCFTVVRATGRATFPACVLLVGTMNLCPCGARGDRLGECACTVRALVSYRNKLSRALIDRFGLVVAMPRVSARELSATRGERTAAIAERVCAAQARLEAPSAWASAARATLNRAVDRLPLSGRGRSRVERVATTIAATAQAEDVRVEHVTEALSYRIPRKLEMPRPASRPAPRSACAAISPPTRCCSLRFTTRRLSCTSEGPPEVYRQGRPSRSWERERARPMGPTSRGSSAASWQEQASSS